MAKTLDEILFAPSKALNPTGKGYNDPKKDANEVVDGKKYKIIGNPPQRIYYEEYGNPGGEPVLMLHGGPGYGTSSMYHQYFDPKFYHIILFDQRNANRSIPNAAGSGVMAHNTPKEMMEDISRLADGFGFDKFHLAGGSWGGYLGPLYAAHYPERLLSLTARAITLGQLSQLEKISGLDANGEPLMKAETEKSGRWIVKGGASKGVDDPSCKIDWDYFYDFAVKHAPDLAKKNPMLAYHQLLNEPTSMPIRLEAAKHMLMLEHVTGDLEHTRTEVAADLDSMTPEHLLSYAMIENNWEMGIHEGLPGFYSQKGNSHFNWFFEGKVEKNGKKIDPLAQIAKVPLIRIVHGQKDNVCPPEDTDRFEQLLRPHLLRIHGTPERVNQALQVARPPDSGHMISDTGIAEALVKFSNDIASIRGKEQRINQAPRSSDMPGGS